MRRSASLSGLLLTLNALLGFQSPAAHGQVTVGYSNSMAGSAARGRIDLQSLRSTRRFEVAGINAQPIDGSLIYDPTTIWTLVDPSQPSALSVLNLDPLLELRQRGTTRDDFRVQRTESVYAAITGPLATTLPVNPRDGVRPLELALPDPLLTVFADPPAQTSDAANTGN